MIAAWSDSHRSPIRVATRGAVEHPVSWKSACALYEVRFCSACREIVPVEQRAMSKTPSLSLRLRIAMIATDPYLVRA